MCSIRALRADNAPLLDTVPLAIQCLLHHIHTSNTTPNSLSIAERNKRIIQRYQAGESQADLARAFDISYQRIHQIVNGR
ncbi:MAG: helix-turn-helix domain-containing protein [Chloroflexota bacterium]